MRGKTIALCAILLSALLLGCAQQEKLNATVIADKMIKKSDEIKDYKTDLFYQIMLGSKSENMTMLYIYKKPDKAYIYNKKLDQIIISNGKTMWTYDKKNNIVYIMSVSKLSEEKRKSLREGLYKSIIENALKNYNLTYFGTTTLDGRKCYVIKLTPKNETKMPVEMKMWIDAEYWLPVKVYSTAKSIFGNITTVVEYRNLSINTGVNDSIFNFTPPKGVKVVYENESTSVKPTTETYKSFEEAQKHVNFTLVVPSYTAGLKLEKITLINSTNQVVMIDYSNSTCRMIISERLGKLIPSPYTKNTTIDGKKVLEWRTFMGGYGYEFVKNGVIVAVLSDHLSKAELKKVVESMLG